MQAERVVLHTDEQGELIEHPVLVPNATIEAIFLIESTEKASEVRSPAPQIAGHGRIVGDIVAPVVESEDWNALQ